MEGCQICGRHPAKRMTFTAHQGFVVFRRVAEISGVFCRDHALEAYFAARGATLKGMWFSPGSLVLGTLQSLYDSAKLLDLPDEVKDEPWVPHIVACPNCRQKIVAPAGPVSCEQCKSVFAVASCASCNAVQVIAKVESFGDAVFTCRVCGRCTKGPEAVRNWALLLLVRAIAEASALVATANGAGGAGERGAFLTAICAVFALDEATAGYVGAYFDQCTTGKPEGLLQQLTHACTREYKTLVLQVALSVAQADGFVDQNETRVLRNLAELLGLDPNRVFEEFDTGTVGNGIGEPWWDVLAVSATASIDEVTFAYRKLAMQFHPDMWVRASESQRQTADARMKRINRAFERAKREIGAREKRDAAARSVAAVNAPAEPTGETREKTPEGDPCPVAPPDVPAAAPAEPEDIGANQANEEKAVESGPTLPLQPVTSRAANEPAPSASSLAILALAISAIIVVAGLAFLLNHERSTHRSLSQQENETTALLPEGSATESVEAASESPTSDPSGETEPNRTQDALDLRGNTRLAIPFDPELAKAYFDAGFAEQRQGRLDDAIASYKRAIQLNPRFTQAYHNRADAYQRKGEFGLAIADYSMAIALNPYHISAYNDRGVAHFALGDYDSAIQDFQKVLSIDPGDADTRENLRKVSQHSQRLTHLVDHRSIGKDASAPREALKYYEKRAAEKSRRNADEP